MNERLGRYSPEALISRTHRLIGWTRGRWNEAKRKPFTKVVIPVLMVSNFSYASVLAIRPQWPEDIWNFVKNTGIGR